MVEPIALCPRHLPDQGEDRVSRYKVRGERMLEGMWVTLLLGKTGNPCAAIADPEELAPVGLPAFCDMKR